MVRVTCLCVACSLLLIWNLVHYSNLSPDVEREIFQRVQMGVVLRESGSLSPSYRGRRHLLTIFVLKFAEKMQAITSPRVDFIRELQRRFIESGQDNTCLADVIDMKVARAQDFQTLAQVVFCVGNLPAEPNYSAGPIDRWLRVQDPVPNQLRMGVIHALTHMYNLATTPGLDSVYKKVDKALAPVEFVFLGEHHADPIPTLQQADAEASYPHVSRRR